MGYHKTWAEISRKAAIEAKEAEIKINKAKLEKLVKALKPHETYDELCEFIATLYSPEELELKKQETQRLIQESRGIKAEK